MKILSCLSFRCTCHAAAFCALAAAKGLPAEVKSFAKEHINFISASPIRQLEMKVFQGFSEIANHRHLQISSTR
jgi:enoyl-[acyl-carrier-protein] reductase (NADH)